MQTLTIKKVGRVEKLHGVKLDSYCLIRISSGFRHILTNC